MYKKTIFSYFALVALLWGNFAQAITFEDLGLTEEDLKYLSPQEKQELLEPKPLEQRVQSEESDAPSIVTPTQEIPQFGEGVTGCFENYTFGSVQAEVSASVASAVSGTSIHFSGFLANNNPYPVVNGTLIVKIFKKRGDVAKNPNGPDVVDEFVALDKVSLKANSKVPVSFDWKVPSFALTGDYQATTFFVSADKFNLLGLSFTDDVVGNSASFKVIGGTGGVFFDKDAVKVDDLPYRFAAFPPRVSSENEIPVSVILANTTNQNERIPLTWKVYAWDSRNEKNLIKEYKETVIVNAQASKAVSYIVSDKEHPVYYVVAEAQYEDVKSILGIRFVRDGVQRARINFPSIATYPLLKGELNSVFSCLHGMGTAPLVKDGKLILSLKDGGRTIYSYEYKGDVTGSMMAVKSDFTPKKTYTDFQLVADLYQGGTLVDSAEMSYSCEAIDKSLCKKYNWLWAVIIFIIATLVSFLIFKRVHRRQVIGTLAVVVLLGGVHFGFAKETQWNSTLGKFAYFWNFGDTSTSATTTKNRYWAPALENPNVTVTYGAQITKEDGEIVAEGSSLPVGTKLKLKFIPHESDDISWFGTGYSGDSPYGEWRENAQPPSVSCAEKDYVSYGYYRVSSKGPFGGGGWNYAAYSVYVPLVIAPPEKEITNLTNLTCSALSGDVMDCTVSAVGPIAPIFKFKPTTGKMYYRWMQVYKSNNNIGGANNVCTGNNVPLRSVEQFTNASVGNIGWNNPDGGLITEKFNDYVTGLGSSAYSVSVPEKTISFSLIGIDAPNNPPQAPVISGPTTGIAGTSYTFSFVSADPDNDEVKYGVDWTGGTTVTQWVPGSGFVADEISQNGSKSWSTPGTYTFKVKAEDIKGGVSEWTSYTITINEAPLPEDPQCGEVMTFSTWPSDSDLCQVGEASDKSFNSSTNQYVWSCEVERVGTTQCVADKPAVAPSTPTVTATGTCGTPGSGKNNISLLLKSTSGSLPANFSIFRSTSQNGTYTEIVSSVSASSSVSGELLGNYTDTNAVPGATYYYKVKAENGAGISNFSVATLGNSPASCEQTIGECGTANDTSISVAPQTQNELCAVGTPSSVWLNLARTKYQWLCQEEGGDYLCEATNTNTGAVSCGSASDAFLSYLPTNQTPGLCINSSPTNIRLNNEGTFYTWSCSGQGSAVSCQAPKMTSNDAQCGGAEGGSYISTPEPTRADLCSAGKSSSPILDPSDSSKYKWTCTSLNNQNSVSCNANVLTVNDDSGNGGSPKYGCGSLDGTDLKSMPTEANSGLCTNDSDVVSGSIDLNGTNRYVWKCSFSDGGINKVSDCSARTTEVTIPEPNCVSNGSCPEIVEDAVSLGDLKTYPGLVNSGALCAVEVGAIPGGVFLSKTENTRCVLRYPNGNTSDEFAPSSVSDRHSSAVFFESQFTLTCYETDPETGAEIAQTRQNKSSICRINPATVETSFLKQMFGNFKDMSASVFDAVLRFFNLKPQ